MVGLGRIIQHDSFQQNKHFKEKLWTRGIELLPLNPIQISKPISSRDPITDSLMWKIQKHLKEIWYKQYKC